MFSVIYLQNSRSFADLAGIHSCAILLGGLISVVAGKIPQRLIIFSLPKLIFGGWFDISVNISNKNENKYINHN